MKGSVRYFRFAITLIVAMMALARPSFAQTVTTGSLFGAIVDEQAAALPGVAVVAVHDATGTRYEAVTNGEGRFEISNIRVGVYTITAKLNGFKDQLQGAVNVALGASQEVNFKMPLATLAESVTVVGQVSDVSSKPGTASNISNEVVESLPTIQRSITDIARTNPFFNPTTLGSSGDKAISVAGQHNRYNNVQIDGAVNNDLFGLADSGTPGGQTGTQPISFDAIDQMQLVVAPYDVKQGGFSGGGINIITKSGTNLFSGTGYYFSRNQSLVGQIPAIATVATPNPSDTKVGPFTEKQGGVSIGGPIMKNKAFFFANVDFDRKTTPAGFSISGTTGQPWGAADTALAQQALSIIQNEVRLQPGRARRIREAEQQRQGVRPGRLQSLAAQSAERPDQLHQRSGQHRHADDDTVPDAGLFLRHSGQAELERRAVEHDLLGQRRQRATRGVLA